MNLLYVWNDYYSDSEERGYLLNSKYNIQFNKSEMKLHIEKNEDYMEGFWGKHVFDAMAVVGKNGAGKTRLANCIMDTLGQLKSTSIGEWIWDDSQFIVVFEDNIEGKNDIKIFMTGQFENIFVKSVNSNLNYELYWTFECKKIEKFKFGYFNSVLDLSDYNSGR